MYENLDLSQYDVERELGAYPYAILRLEYHRRDLLESEGICYVSDFNTGLQILAICVA